MTNLTIPFWASMIISMNFVATDHLTLATFWLLAAIFIVSLKE